MSGSGRAARAPLPAALPTLVRLALVMVPLALLWPALRHAVESRMSLHMLLEFPALFAAGWSAWRLAWPVLARRRQLRRLARGLATLDWQGWTSATLTSGVALAWMIPSALDAALLSDAVAVAKWASWPLAGALLAARWHRMDPGLLLFVLGNQAWMAATAGLLYLDAPAALCVNYLQDDQRHAGLGLVLLACALGVLALRPALRAGPADGVPTDGVPTDGEPTAAPACNITEVPRPAHG